jgi:hypothetical protein
VLVVCPKAVRIVSLIRRVVNANARGVASRQRLYHPLVTIWPVRRALERLHTVAVAANLAELELVCFSTSDIAAADRSPVG